MPVFAMRKVIDPYKHMPKDIKETFFKAFRADDRANDSFIEYSAGEYVCLLEPGEEDGPNVNVDLVAFDNWTLENFEKNESLLILYWW